MLITCFQCRQQLEVPDDSAGKRIHCPHCDCVVVVPAASKLAPFLDEAETRSPITALPNMELDDAAAAPPVSRTNVASSFPLPPSPERRTAPPAPPKSPPTSRKSPRVEPGSRPIQKSVLRRSLFGRWRAAGAASLLVTVILMIVVAGLMFSWRSQKRARVQHHLANRPQPQRPLVPAPPAPPVVVPPFLAKDINRAVAGWHEYVNVEHRFKVLFQAQPLQKNEVLGTSPMTVFYDRQGPWEFSVAHCTFAEKEYLAIPLANRFAQVQRDLAEKWGAALVEEKAIELRDGHPGRAWTFARNGGQGRVHLHTYFVRDGDRYHHYALTVTAAPFTDASGLFKVARFLASFHVLPGLSAGNSHIGQVVFQESDDLNRGGRRDNEFTAIALHPTKPIAVVGTVASQVQVIRLHGEKPTTNLLTHESRPIEQLCFSADGRWLAVAVGGKIQLWLDWDEAVPHKKDLLPGGRCVFTQNHHLLTLNKDTITEYDPETRKDIGTLEVRDRVLSGLEFSPDGQVLALCSEKDIQLWQWPAKKLVGTLTGHQRNVTAIAFAPDGKTLASASVDRTVKLWDLPTRQERATLRQHAWTVWNLAFAPDSTHLASVGLDGMFLLWDVQPDMPALVWAQSQQYPVRTVAWDPEGKNVYLTSRQTGSAELGTERTVFRKLRKIARADMQANRAEAEKIVAERAGFHVPSANGAFFLSADEKTLITLADGQDRQKDEPKLRIWDAATGQIKFVFPCKNGGALSPDGKWFVFSKPGPRTQLQLVEVRTGIVLADRVRLDTAEVPFAIYSQDSTSLWVQVKQDLLRFHLPEFTLKQRLSLKNADDPHTIKIIPAMDRKSFLVEKSLPEGGLRTRALYATSDGEKLPLGQAPAGEKAAYLKLRRSKNGLIHLDDVLTGSSHVIGQQGRGMMSSALHPEGKLAASEDSAREQILRIHFWDLPEHRPLLTLPDASARASPGMRFSGDGALFSYTTTSGWTRIIPTAWLLERKDLLPCHESEVSIP